MADELPEKEARLFSALFLMPGKTACVALMQRLKKGFKPTF